MKKFLSMFIIVAIMFAAPAFCAARKTQYKSKPVLTKTQIKQIKKKIEQKKGVKEETSSSKKSSKKNKSERVRRQEKIRDIGYNILNSNEIDKRMTFAYSLSYKNPNAYIHMKRRDITVNKGLMDMIESDDELAFILGHEISHGIDSYWGPANGLFYNPQFNFVSRRIETRCDLRGLDFMVKAGYNPVAGLIISNKLFDQPVNDYFLSHPLGSRRLATMYVYIKNTYPQFLKDNEFIENPVYKNILISNKRDIEKMEQKFEKKFQKNLSEE